MLTKPEDKPVPLASGIRAVIKGVKISITDIDIGGFDYWALNNRGHFFFIRSYEGDIAPPRVLREKSKLFYFDVAIWRISEILSYTSNLCSELNLKQNDEVKLTLSYEGLKGRILSTSDPLRIGVRGECAEEKFEKDLELQVKDIMPQLKERVYQITLRLFGLFDFTKLDRVTVDSIVDRFLNSRL